MNRAPSFPTSVGVLRSSFPHVSGGVSKQFPPRQRGLSSGRGRGEGACPCRVTEPARMNPHSFLCIVLRASWLLAEGPGARHPVLVWLLPSRPVFMDRAARPERPGRIGKSWTNRAMAGPCGKTPETAQTSAGRAREHCPGHSRHLRQPAPWPACARRLRGT